VESTTMNRIPLLRTGSLAFLVAVLLATAPAAKADDRSEERFEKTYDLEGVQKVRLQNVNGAVHIDTWDQPGLHVLAVKRAKGSRPDETLKSTEIRVRKTSTAIEIETILPKTSSWGLFSWWVQRSAEVTYELKLPAAIAVHVETVNGRVLAERRSGPIVLKTVNGTIKITAQDGAVHANTINGSIDVAFTGLARKSELETVNGSVTVAAARESSIRYSLQTVNGRIRSDFADLNVKGKWGPKEARGEVNGGREPISVETVNGEVRLQVADAAVPR
jgi:DUF4097 and DUF4098 domain-containing protein YvlB